MQDAVFYQPDLDEHTKLCKVVVHQHKYDLVFSNKGKCFLIWLFVLISYAKGKLMARIHVQFSTAGIEEGDFDADDVIDQDNQVSAMLFPKQGEDDDNGEYNEKFINNNDNNSKENKEKFIRDLNLKHVSADDLTAVLEALIVTPEIPKNKK
jgi:hypothetical protein